MFDGIVMNNKEFSRVLEDRTKAFAITVFKFSSSLPDTTEWRVLKRQFVISGTSIGANYREANRSRSKAEFRSKIRICEGETSECIYWLSIINTLLPDKTIVLDVEKEAREFLAIFSTISKNTKL